jgi:hypothetical protein
VTWLALGGATLLQLLAGVVRVRGWFHVIRHCRGGAGLAYRDVVVAHLGGCGWNAVLPARAGDAVKVALVKRRLPDMPLASVATTLLPPALLDAALTAALVTSLVAAGVLSPSHLSVDVPLVSGAALIGGLAAVALAAAVCCRARLRRLARDIRSGLAIVDCPRLLATRVLPWQAAARGVRLVALGLVLAAAGVPLGFWSVLALLALQAATPSLAPTAAAIRVALLAGALTHAGATGGSSHDLVALLVAWYGASSVLNLAASAIVAAAVLRTFSPRAIVGFARSAWRPAPPEVPAQTALRA